MSEPLLETALRLRQAGRLKEAADIYRRILERDPAHFEALHALGLVRYQGGELEEAERLIGEAVAVKPHAPEALYNRACLLMRLKRPDEALRSFDAAIAVKPDYLEALVNRGNLLAGMNRQAAALESFERALTLRPAIAELWLSRAVALLGLGRFGDAVSSCDRALALRPDNADAVNLRSEALAAQRARSSTASHRPSLGAFEQDVADGRLRDALERGIQILRAIDDNFGRLHGVDFDGSLSDGSDEPAARRFCTRFASSLGKLLLDTELELSSADYERLLPHHRWIDVVLSLSDVTRADHRPLRTGESELSKLLARLVLRPLNTGADIDLERIWHAAPLAAPPAFLRYASSPYVFRPRAFELRERLLEWLPRQLQDVTLSPVTLSRIADIYMHCSYAVTPDKHAIKRALMTQMRRALLETGCPELPADTRGPIEERPTIVVVAENLRPGHSVHRTHSRAIASLRERFRVIGIVHPNPKGTPIEALFDEHMDMQGAEFFQLVSYLANQILARKPALVFYLGVGMMPQVVALASLRLAPIQCVSFGHTATTMSPAMDYFVLPEDFVASENVFSERVLKLPISAMPLAPRLSRAVTRSARSDGVIRIAVPGSTMKLNPKLFDAVADIVARARTRTEVQFFPLGAVGLAYVELARVVAERIKGASVCPELPHEAYMERLSQCDFFLSPFPYGNMNSVVDCFQLGLPGVCLDGPEPHARADGAFFERIGLPQELVAQTTEDYVAAAVRLIDDTAWRSQCRKIVADADLDTAFFTGDASMFCKALADLISSQRK